MVEDYGCIKDNCPHKSARANNCEEPSSTDGLVVQCVDAWAEDKFYYFDKYLNATRKARAKYSQNGNAVYIDLFAGPGLCRIKERKFEIKGGAIRAVSLDEAPFNKIILNDLSQVNNRALLERIPNAEHHNDDANKLVVQLVDKHIAEGNFKYHFVFLDPFSNSNLKFNTLRKLAELKHVDIMINFPISPLRRFHEKWSTEGGEHIDDFFGTDAWRDMLKDSSDSVFCERILGLYYKQMLSIGFPEEGLGIIDEEGNNFLGSSIARIKNSKNSVLYYLILASKHKLGADIWRSILKIPADGQRGLF